MNIKSRIHRTIKDFDNYHVVDKDSINLLENLNLHDKEICYGVYENNPQGEEEKIAITNKGMYLYKSNVWHFINFDEIDAVSIKSEKQNAEYITLNLKNGETLLLPVRGGRDNFRDVFEFSRFLARVVSDIKNQDK